jgi:hypothetical protein
MISCSETLRKLKAFSPSEAAGSPAMLATIATAPPGPRALSTAAETALIDRVANLM